MPPWVSAGQQFGFFSGKFFFGQDALRLEFTQVFQHFQFFRRDASSRRCRCDGHWCGGHRGDLGLRSSGGFVHLVGDRVGGAHHDGGACHGAQQAGAAGRRRMIMIQLLQWMV